MWQFAKNIIMSFNILNEDKGSTLANTLLTNCQVARFPWFIKVSAAGESQSHQSDSVMSVTQQISILSMLTLSNIGRYWGFYTGKLPDWFALTLPVLPHLRWTVRAKACSDVSWPLQNPWRSPFFPSNKPVMQYSTDLCVKPEKGIF